VLWVSKYQRVSKCRFLRDRWRKLADLCLGKSPIYYTIMDHKRTQEVSVCLLRNLADIAWDDSIFD
jgi:hypothetical protein